MPSDLLLYAEQVFWQFFSLIVYFTAFLTLVWMYVRQNPFTERSHMISKSVYSTTIDCTNSSRWNAAGNKECVLKHCLLKFFVLVHCDSNTIDCVILLFYYANLLKVMYFYVLRNLFLLFILKKLYARNCESDNDTSCRND